MKKKMKYDDGFTFVETIAVVAIMLILSAGVGVSASKYIEKAKIAATENQIEIFKMALHAYFLDCGRYPSKEQGLEALWIKPVKTPVPQNWQGPYLEKKIKPDAWGSDFVYEIENSFGLPFVIYSYGSDGKKGGLNNEADILSY